MSGALTLCPPCVAATLPCTSGAPHAGRSMESRGYRRPLPDRSSMCFPLLSPLYLILCRRHSADTDANTQQCTVYGLVRKNSEGRLVALHKNAQLCRAEGGLWNTNSSRLELTVSTGHLSSGRLRFLRNVRRRKYIYALRSPYLCTAARVFSRGSPDTSVHFLPCHIKDHLLVTSLKNYKTPYSRQNGAYR